MRTTKPFSTISYNTVPFLTEKLDDLVRKRILSFYAFVRHYAEEDEKKDHIHLYCIPNGTVNTDSITDLLLELDPSKPLMPLGVVVWRPSHFDDWYLYTSHDTAYLMTKGQTRKYHYQESDFHTSSEDYLHELISTIDRTKYAKTKDFVDAIENGADFRDLLKKGQIPAPQFNQWFSMYAYIKNGDTFRNGRFTHSSAADQPAPFHGADTLRVDRITGEIFTDPDRSVSE